MKNKYASTCDKCGTKVPANSGELMGPPWKVFCEDCADTLAPSQSYGVKVELSEAGFAVSCAAHMPGKVFAAYKEAYHAAGGHYDPSLKASVIPESAGAAMIDRLTRAGFVVSPSQAVMDRMRGFAKATMAAAVGLGAHLAGIEGELQDKGLKLYKFQRSGVEWLVTRQSGLLGDEMGLGKTVQVLSALPLNASKARVLVVCPVVARGVWAAEAAKWRSSYKVTKISSFRWPEPGEIAILSYTMLPEESLLPGGTKAPEGTILVADEAHAVKNPKTARTQKFRRVSECVRAAAGRVWLLTATPLLNRPQELWSVLGCGGLAHEAFGSWSEFKHAFQMVKGAYGGYSHGMPMNGVADQLGKVMIRRERKAVLPDLPSKSHQMILVNGLDAKTKSVCDEVLAALEELGVDLEKDSDFAKIFTLKGPVFELIAKARAALAHAKIPHMLEVVEEYEESGEPLVVFCSHRAPIDLLGKREGWETITGDDSPEARTAKVAKFQAGELKGLALTIQSGGTAITLHHASHALFVDLAWTPALNAQAEDRLVRIGATAEFVLIKLLVAEHALDKRVCQLLQEKQALIDASIGKVESEVQAGPNAAAAAAQAAALLAKFEMAAAKAKTSALAQQVGADTKVAAVAAAKPRHVASNVVEAWAIDALKLLASFDTDHATYVNGVGFNKLDGPVGHSLVEAHEGMQGLTDAQWGLAIVIAKHYPKQVGSVPGGEA